MFRAAAQVCEHVIVVINSDQWLMRKKGYCFHSWSDRRDMLNDNRYVSQIEWVNDDDNTVCEALRRLRPTYFGNGGDRGAENTPELTLCRELGIEPVFGLGGGKQRSSSILVEQAIARIIGSRRIIVK